MFSRVPATISGSKSEAMAFMPMLAASITIPPVPQNGSRTVPPLLTPVRLIKARAYFGCREMGEKNGLSLTFLSLNRSASNTLSSMNACTWSVIRRFTTVSGCLRSTSLFLENTAPTLRIRFWESTSAIHPLNRLCLRANVPAGSPAPSMGDKSSGSKDPRYLPTL